MRIFSLILSSSLLLLCPPPPQHFATIGVFMSKTKMWQWKCMCNGCATAFILIIQREFCFVCLDFSLKHMSAPHTHTQRQNSISQFILFRSCCCLFLLLFSQTYLFCLLVSCGFFRYDADCFTSFHKFSTPRHDATWQNNNSGGQQPTEHKKKIDAFGGIH